MKKIICLVLAGAAIPVFAQLRMVNGQLYRVDDPSVWRVFPDLQVVSIFPDGALEVREVFQQYGAYNTVGIKKGLYGTETTSYQTSGASFVLLHYRSNMALAPGMDIGYVKAMFVPPVTVASGQRSTMNVNDNYGTANATFGSEYDAVTYDMGIPYYPPQPKLTPEQITARKMAADSNIVAFLKVQASNGIPDEQCELGERYMKGDGLPQDKTTGQMWLAKAEGGGSIQASNDLQALALTNSLAGK